jgi:hypothetical protein
MENPYPGGNRQPFFLILPSQGTAGDKINEAEAKYHPLHLVPANF